MMTTKQTKHSVLLTIILLFGVIFWGCSELEPTANNEETEGFALSEQEVTAEDSLFVIVSDPILSEEQERNLAEIRDRQTTAEVHFAYLVDNPTTLLVEGKELGLRVSDEELFVAIGERVTQRESGRISWVGPLKNQFGRATLALSSKGFAGTLRTETSLYKFESLGDGLQAIILIDPSKFPPEHPPLHH